MTHPTCSLTFSMQNPSSRAFLSVGVMAAVGVFCALAVSRLTLRWYPRPGINAREDRGYAVLIFSAV